LTSIFPDIEIESDKAVLKVKDVRNGKKADLITRCD